MRLLVHLTHTRDVLTGEVMARWTGMPLVLLILMEDRRTVSAWVVSRRSSVLPSHVLVMRGLLLGHMVLLTRTEIARNDYYVMESGSRLEVVVVVRTARLTLVRN